MNSQIESLASRFEVPGLRFEEGSGGLLRAVVHTPVAKGEIYLHGAHVASFQPAGQPPVIWMSAAANFESGKPIRGGVPICFPWFGPHPSDASAPMHGTARTKEWEMIAASRLADGGIGIAMQTTIDAMTLRFQVNFGLQLQMSLHTELPFSAESSVRLEEALHTYFHVGDIRSVSIDGLESVQYYDKMNQGTLTPASQQPIRFTCETDRVYFDTGDTCVLHDPALQRTITVRKTGSRSTVVWNPWIAKSAKLPDFGDQEWPTMVCIESANAANNAIELQPGQNHTLSVSIHSTSVPPL